MGRLRNLSESFKAAVNYSSTSLSKSPSGSQTQIVDKDSPVQPQTQPSPTEPPQSNSRIGRTKSRPTSMVYTSPAMEIAQDNNVGELLPVFNFLSSQTNKLYQEGYFLKLNDLDTREHSTCPSQFPQN
jgi:CCR4-NOT transcriptional complex subunit CAF120